MSGPPSLDHLPVELLELCVNLLNFHDMGNLRLTNVEVAAKVSEGCFKVHFANAKLCLNDRNQIANFAKVTQAGCMGTLLRNLTIVTVVPVHKTAKKLPRKDIELLELAFSNLRDYSAS